MRITKTLHEVIDTAVKNRYELYISELWRERRARQAEVAAKLTALAKAADEEAHRICESAGLSVERELINFSTYYLDYCNDPEIVRLRKLRETLSRAPKRVTNDILLKLETGSLKKNELEAFLDNLDFTEYIRPEDAL